MLYGSFLSWLLPRSSCRRHANVEGGQGGERCDNDDDAECDEVARRQPLDGPG